MSDTVYEYELITIDDRQNGDFSAKNIMITPTGSVVGQLDGENVRIEGQQMGEITALKASVGPKATLRNCVLHVGQLASHPDATYKRCVLYLDTPVRALGNTFDEALGDANVSANAPSQDQQVLSFIPTPAAAHPTQAAMVEVLDGADDETAAMLERELGLEVQGWSEPDIAKVENLTSELQALSELVRRESLAAETLYATDPAHGYPSGDDQPQAEHVSQAYLAFDDEVPTDRDDEMPQEREEGYRRLPSLF